MRLCTSLLAALPVLLLGSAARAWNLAPGPGWYIPVGVNLGASLVPPQDRYGLVVGLEGSAAWIEDLVWYGGYVDCLYDSGLGMGRVSLGPEVGFAFFGIDGGAVIQMDEHGATLGLAVRPVVTIGFAAVYGRWIHLFDGGAGLDVGEVGMLFKVPIPLED